MKGTITMKKILAAALSLCLCCAALTACGDSDSSSKAESASASAAQTDEGTADTGDQKTDEGTDTPAVLDDSPSAQLLSQYPVNDGAFDPTQGATENMLARGILNEGDTSRLAAKLKYAVDNPKETTKICFLGDSITQGSSADSSTKQYVNQYKTWWEENVSFYVDVKNAGIGATDSYIGVHRAARDVLADQPDIIFIEFINDQDNEFYGACMDSLVRMCLAQENNPAVIIIEPTTEDGGSPQNVHLKVAQAYNIPMISYHDAIIPEIEAGNFEWSKLQADVVHPNSAGHTIMAQLLTNFSAKIKDNLGSENTEATPFDAATEAPYGDKYAGAQICDRDSELVETVDEGTFTDVTNFQQFTNGWGTKTGGTIKMKVTGKNIGLIYYMNVDGTYGSVDVKVDGESVKMINADFTGGWGNYAKADEIYSSDEVAEHEIEITVIDDAKPNFQILNMIVS